jgi:acetylornithine deacetylase/succinyl-diaminopimelate desuccinylase-like protein
MLDRVLETIESRKSESLSALKEWLAIPSVSTKPEHAPDMKRAAQWLADQLKFGGLDVSIMETGGAPAVVAKNKHEKGRPTILVYGHYDVQPPEPLELWTTPPFEPTVRKDDNGFDAVFARGAVDDKGQVWCHAEAILAWQAHTGLPINITLLIEGEEEIGSTHLEDFIRNNKAGLKADLCLISDTDQFARGLPAITYGLRGLVYEEIFLTGPGHDLHSGGYGGAVPNPANILCEIIGSLHNSDGTVNIPGFYDDVAPPSPEERAIYAKLPHDEKQFEAELKLPFLNGEKGFSTLERVWVRPTLDVNGLSAGYQGKGAKTVIPSKASAKVSMRLVPNQDPQKVREAFEKTVRERCPKNVKVEFVNYGCAKPVVVPITNRATQLAREALQVGFAQQSILQRCGGTIPVVGTINEVLGIDTLLVGFGLPDDRVHSPNEKFDLEALHKGTRTCAALYERLAKMNQA